MTKVGNKKVFMMEDKHTCLPNLGGDPNKALFCVFDGHSGNNNTNKITTLTIIFILFYLLLFLIILFLIP